MEAYWVREGTPITFTAKGSINPNNDTLRSRWDFDDGGKIDIFGHYLKRLDVFGVYTLVFHDFKHSFNC